MTLFAWINSDNVVVNVTVCENELLTQLGVDASTETQEQFYTQIINQKNIYAKITSYDAHGEEGDYRGRYAGIGYTYDADNDVFVAPPSPEPLP